MNCGIVGVLLLVPARRRRQCPSPVQTPPGGRRGRPVGRRLRQDGGVTADLLARAQAGDADAFAELVEPHRRELQVHCYRILGSATDAEDVLQEALLAAWQGLSSFEGRASVR